MGEPSIDGNKEGTTGSLLRKDDRDEESTDDICGWRCGSKCFVPFRWLQSLATPKWSLFFLCMCNIMQQTVLNGLIAVTISTLEKRFELRSTESGLIAGMGDFGRGMTMFLIMFISSRVDKPRLIGWGLIATGIGSILFTLPHFTAPEYTPVLEDILNQCGNVTEPNCSQSAMRNYLYWFIVCFCVIGIGSCPMLVYSLTYLDENVKKRNSAMYASIYMSCGGLGPAVGFVFGGMALEMYTYPLQEDLEITSSSYSWVGAWWIGYVVFGVLIIVNAITVLLLPKYLPGTEKHRQNRDAETQKSHLKSSKENDKSSVLGTFTEILYLMRNKPYMIMTFGLGMDCALVYGFNTFGAKYLESVFGLTPFHASLLYGISSLVAGFGAQFCSGLVVKKFDLQVPGILKFMIVTGIISAICSIGFLVHCEDIDFAGGTVPYSGYENTGEPLSVLSSCNSNCSCTTDRYEPVCADGITYYSPCFAGCRVKLNATSYTDCSCAMHNVSYVDRNVIMSSEACDWKPCGMIYPFIGIVLLCFFTSILTMPTGIQVILRCVPFDKRDMAMSFQLAIRHIVGVIPGRLLVGYVLDQACVSWSTECGEQGACKVYNRWEIARNNTILLVSQTVVCVIAYTLVYVTYKPVAESVADDTTELGNVKRGIGESQTSIIQSATCNDELSAQAMA